MHKKVLLVLLFFSPLLHAGGEQNQPQQRPLFRKKKKIGPDPHEFTSNVQKSEEGGQPLIPEKIKKIAVGCSGYVSSISNDPVDDCVGCCLYVGILWGLFEMGYSLYGRK